MPHQQGPDNRHQECLPEEERATGASRTSKMIIDATKYDSEKFEIPCLPARQTMRRVEENWEKYGLKYSARSQGL